jgi:adenylylsulfate kinase
MSTPAADPASFRETHGRSLLKTMSWRVMATTTTMVVVYMFTGKALLAGGIGLVEAISKMLLYYFHERAWSKSTFGMSNRAHKSPHVVSHSSDVSSLERRQESGHKPATIWLTGVPGAGKTTLAYALERELFDKGCHTYVLDGENLRLHLSRDLGFEEAERTENIRRAAEVASMMNTAGVIAICALISPYTEDRRTARSTIGDESFIEVHLTGDTDLFLKRSRLGNLAQLGSIKHFTGVSHPYESPTNAALELRTDMLSVDECVRQIVSVMDGRKIVD